MFSFKTFKYLFTKQMTKQLNRNHNNNVLLSVYRRHANLQAPRLTFVCMYRAWKDI